jgi:hypothetical protein
MDNATALSLGRIGLGAAAWGAPGLAGTAMMLGRADAQAAFLLRLFGARDVALGVATLLVPAPARPAMLGIGLAVDASDAAAALLGARSGALRPLPALLVAGTASAAVAAGAAALRAARAPRPAGHGT